MVAVDMGLRDDVPSGPEMTPASGGRIGDADHRDAEGVDGWAQRLIAEDEDGARALAQAIERRLSTGSLDQLERVWDLSANQAASLFCISRQAYAKWRVAGIPADRRVHVDEIGAITTMLLDHVKVDRIPGVVRRSAAMLGGASIVDLVREDLRAAREAVAHMLDLRRVQP